MAKKGDMTKGNPAKLILAFSLPMILGNVVQQLYSMVDSAIVGRFVGKNALAAIGSTQSVLLLMICIIIGFTMGTCICASQAYGAQDREGLKNIAGTAIIIALGLTAFIFIIGWIVVVPVLRCLNTPEEIIPDARIYLLINTCTSAAPIFYNMEANLMRALGDSKSSLYAIFCASLLNVGLDLLFVCAFGWGVAGAAIATAISQFGSALVCLIRILLVHEELHIKAENLKPRRSIIVKIISIGVPMSFQNGVASIGAMGIQSFVNGYGTNAMAAYTAAGKIDQISLMPLNSVGMAVSTFVGQNFGAQNMKRIKQGVRDGLLQGIAWGIGLMILINLISGFLVGLFVSSDEVEVIAIGREYLRIVTMFYWECGVMYVLLNAFRGMGNMRLSTLASCLDPLGRLFFAWILSTWIAGRAGLWMGWPCGWLCALAPTAVLWFLKYQRADRLEELDIRRKGDRS